jgi:signal transduction histidine kinase
MKVSTTGRSEVFRVLGVWLGCLLVLCGLWLASIFHFVSNARKANAIRLAAHRLRLHELEARRAEKDFVLRSLDDSGFFREGNSKYLSRHRAELKSLRAQIEVLAGKVATDQEARLAHLRDLVDEYERGFEALVLAYRDRGYREWGLEGVLRRSFAAIKQEVDRAGSPALERAALRLDGNDRVSSLDPGPENAAQVVADLSALREAAVAEPASPGRQAILDQVEEYRAAFGKLQDLEKRIGYGEEEGLQGRFRDAVHAIEPVVEQILEEALVVDEGANRTLMFVLLGTCFTMAVLLALAVIFAQTARHHTRSLIEVNRRMEEDHRKLLQSERLAAIGQVVTGLTHESRNALQRTHACLDMLSQEVKDRPRALELVARIEESQDHLHFQYEQVREYAAPLRVAPVPTRLEEVVEAAWARLDHLHGSRDVRFRQHRESSSLDCEVDRFAIEQAFRNIFENSLAAGKDPVEIDVRYRDGRLPHRPGPSLTVSVRDNGPGLDGEQRARIFEPFYTTKTRGTGLGMAIARRLVEAHGGTIELGPLGPPGAEVVVTLPRKAQGGP